MTRSSELPPVPIGGLGRADANIANNNILMNTVNPLLSSPGGLFFSSTFEGGLKREGELI